MPAQARLLCLMLVLGLGLIGLAVWFPPGPRPASQDSGFPADDLAQVTALVPPPRAARVVAPMPAGAIRRFGELRFEHPGPVTDLTFAAGGSWLVACGGSGGARIWDTRTGRVVRRFGGGDGGTYVRVAVSTDNAVLSAVVGNQSWDGNVFGPQTISVRRYDVMSGRELTRATITDVGKAPTVHVAFGPGGTSLFAGDEGGALNRYDPVTGRRVWQYRPHPHYELKAVTVAPNGRTVVVSAGAADGQVRLLNAETGTPVADLNGIEGGPGAVGFSGDGRSLAATTAARNKGVTVWSLYPLVQRRVLNVHCDPAIAPVLSPGGQTVAVWGWMDPPPYDPLKDDGKLRWTNWRAPPSRFIHTFDTATGAHRAALWQGSHRSAPPTAFTPDGATIAVGGDEISLWDPVTGSRDPRSPEQSGFGWQFSPYFSRDGRHLLFTQVEGGDVVTRDLIAERETAREPKAGTAFWKYGVGSFEYHQARSADGRLVADWRSITRDPFERQKAPGIIRVRDAGTDREVAQIEPASAHEQAVAFSLDGKQLATRDTDTVRVYDIATKKLVANLGPGPADSSAQEPRTIWCTASPDRRYLAVNSWHKQSGPHTVTILSTATWQPVRGVRLAPNDEFDWSGNDRFTLRTREPSTLYLIFPADRVHRVAEWDVVAGCVSARAVTVPEQSYRTVSRNGRMVAAWGEVREHDGYPIRVFEVESGRERHRFVCDEMCRSAYFSPDGRFLLGHHPGESYLLWDVRGASAAHAGEPPGAQALDRAWADLNSDDAPAAFRAIRLLTRHPDLAIPLLRSKLPPAAPPNPAAVGRLISALGAEEFGEREVAEKELERLGKSTLALLRAARSSPVPEVGRRATALVHRIGNAVPEGPQLVPARAIEAVEWMGTPEAIRLLEEWANGAEGARLTAEARAALARRME